MPIECTQCEAGLNTQPSSRVILSVSEAMKRCQKVLEEARFAVSKCDEITLICVRTEICSQRLIGLRVVFNRISSDLTQVTFLPMDTGLGTLHCDLFKRRIIGLKKIIERQAA